MIHGFVDQSVEEALDDLEHALALAPPHLSLYQLTIESKTSFGLRASRGETLLATDTRLVEMYEALSERLIQAKTPLYEVSNAAQKGHESLHNSTYWKGYDYFALGTGAHGLIMNPTRTQGQRWQNQRHVNHYINNVLSIDEARDPSDLPTQWNWIEEEDQLDEWEILEERILVGLRLMCGVEVSPLMRTRYQPQVTSLVEQGLMIDEAGRWRVTPQGRLLLDHVTFKILVS